ncbi:MAG: hypothetical protein NTZ36_03300 [Candidatus Jorgensenbacteria bacterium]|nr:hypothetical protein [Candidatus Jorgensenbacteria bacterium]
MARMYEIGQRVCLWDAQIFLGSTEARIIREVVVTVTETKTGVPGEFSKYPSPFESLRGIGEDGKIYEKHWELWPEIYGCNFSTVWSTRSDDGHMWTPVESLHLYNELVSHENEPNDFTLVDSIGNAIRPKGDFYYCEEHDSYWSRRIECFWCNIDNLSKRKRALARVLK